jgi:thiamine-monophosphate kinase
MRAGRPRSASNYLERYFYMPKKPVSPVNENRIIQLLQKFSPKGNPLIKKGIGDDAAVIISGNAKERWVVTTDMLLENIDFRRDWITPGELGYKSLAVNLSDLAAMGAQPRFFTVSLALPSDISEKWILDFYGGLTELSNSKKAWLIGGDLSGSKSGIFMSITALGESRKGKILYRSGGRPGDLLYVTGKLGQSAAGLNLLQNGCIRPRGGPQKEALLSHRKPEPRCETGLWLAQCGFVRCMMDLSDGFSTDLPRMCSESGVGAEIDVSRLPVFSKSSLWNCNPVDLALNGGEDFELLFAVPKKKALLFEKSYPNKFPKITCVGEMTSASNSLWLHDAGKNRRPMLEQGFDHFRRLHP